MLDRIRSLNLSNSVSIVLYEALRQHDFAGMQLAGALHHGQWENILAVEKTDRSV